MPKKNRIAYYFHPDVGHFDYGKCHPMKPERLAALHSLVTNYGLHEHMTCIESPRASAVDITRFHSPEYVQFLEHITPETADQHRDLTRRFNMDDDSPVFPGMFSFCSLYTGGTIAAAERLNHQLCDIAINWSGGLHHAKKDAASGFCYVNDIVIGIMELLKRHERVLYIDIDVHHGDGVQEAFSKSDRVMTMSFHRYGDLFFPLTGSMYDVGRGDGRFYSVNVPLKPGISDETYHSLFKPIVKKAVETFDPKAIVMQCGADSLLGDLLGNFSLTIDGHAECIRYVKNFGIPMLVLGGGGYTPKNVSRCWAFETAVLVEKDQEIPNIIPEDIDYDLKPASTLSIADENPTEYLSAIRSFVLSNLHMIRSPPSMQMTPIVDDYYDHEDMQNDDEPDEPKESRPPV
uniref:Histone deacetylase n=1 Tax=Steinernema glaseri TaxID=37863 RepID=A0A1I7YU77_9BILA